MTFKRTVALCLAAALLTLAGGALSEACIFPVEPAEITQADITMEAAISAAQAAMVSRHADTSFYDFQNYNIKAGCVLLETGQKAWVVMLDEQSYRLDAVVTVSATDGAILAYQETDAETREILDVILAQWEAEKGDMDAWSLQDSALFDWLYGFTDRYIYPGEEHISQEAARDIALSAIPEPVAAPECSYSFNLFTYTDGTPEQYVWLVTISENGQARYVVHVSAVDGAVLDVFAMSSYG